MCYYRAGLCAEIQGKEIHLVLLYRIGYWDRMSNLYATDNKVNVNQSNMKLKYILNAIIFVLALSFLSMCIFKTTEYCFNHYRNIFFTLNVHNNDNDLIVANVFIIASVKYIYFSKRPRRCSSYSQLNHCLIIIQTIQRIGDFGLFKLDYPQI